MRASGLIGGVLLGLMGVLAEPRAEPASSEARPEYANHHRCGVVDISLLPARTSLRVDLNGDGQPEDYVATWGGVERYRLQPGTHPPTLVRDAWVYQSSVNDQYSCVDLRAMDLDRDGDLDLLFGSHRELVWLMNDHGRLRPERREAQDLPRGADLRIEIGPAGPRLVSAS